MCIRDRSGSVEFATYVDIMLGEQLFVDSGLGETVFRQAVLENTSDVVLDERLGVWDPERLAIVNQ